MHTARVREGEKSFMGAINYLHVGERSRDHPSNSPEWAGTAVLRVCVCVYSLFPSLFFCVSSSIIYEATVWDCSF